MNWLRRSSLTLLAVCSTACLVEVRQVKDPGPTFARAQNEAQALRGRPAHRLVVLAFDPDDGELVRVELPLSLARKLVADGDLNLGDDERLGRKLRGRVTLEQLEAQGAGPLVEVEDEDGERVLVYLK